MFNKDQTASWLLCYSKWMNTSYTIWATALTRVSSDLNHIAASLLAVTGPMPLRFLCAWFHNEYIQFIPMVSLEGIGILLLVVIYNFVNILFSFLTGDCEEKSQCA